MSLPRHGHRTTDTTACMPRLSLILYSGLFRRTAPRLHCEGPRPPWAHFQVAATCDAVQAKRHFVSKDCEFDTWFASWSKQFEAWLLSTCVDVENASFARGTRLELEHRPKVQATPLNVHWKDRQSNYWHGLCRIVSDLARLIEETRSCLGLEQKLLCKLSCMSADVVKHWPRGTTKCHFQPVGLQYALNVFGAAAPHVRRAVLEDLTHHSASVLKTEKEQRKFSARHLSLSKGGKLAHRALKAGEAVLERPYGAEPVHLRPSKRREYWLA